MPSQKCQHVSVHQIHCFIFAEVILRTFQESESHIKVL